MLPKPTLELPNKVYTFLYPIFINNDNEINRKLSLPGVSGDSFEERKKKRTKDFRMICQYFFSIL